MSTVIKIESLYKEYRLGVIGHGTLHQDLQSWWAKLRGRDDPNSIISDNPIHSTSTGRVLALKDINLEVEKGEVLGIIGANGAGKTTLLMTICGAPAAARGSIRFEETELTAMKTHDIVRLGIAQAPEGRRIFPRMTVLENLQMGAVATDEAHFEIGRAHV